MVGSKATPMEGVVRNITIKIEDRNVYTSFKAIPSDKFHVILGVKFMWKAYMVPIPFLNSFIMMLGDAPMWSLQLGEF